MSFVLFKNCSCWAPVIGHDPMSLISVRNWRLKSATSSQHGHNQFITYALELSFYLLPLPPPSPPLCHTLFANQYPSRPASVVTGYTGVYARPGGGGLEKSLRDTVRTTLLSDVVRMDGGGNGSGGSRRGIGGDTDSWRVMVLDARATRVISSVVGMYDIMEGHVTVVEDLHKVCVEQYWFGTCHRWTWCWKSFRLRILSRSEELLVVGLRKWDI